MFVDSRWQELADILVNYSTRVAAGERVLISMGEADTLPLAEATYEAVIRAGGFPEIYYTSEVLKRSTLLHGTEEQVRWSPEIEATGMQWADAYVGIRGSRNPFEFHGVSPDRLALHKGAMGRNSALRQEHTRWVLVKVPNEAFAQQVGRSHQEIMEFFFRSTLRDWSAERSRLTRLAEIFQAAKEVRITGTDTDLTFGTEGRTYEAAAGEFNMPDGEIFTSPMDGTADGSIYFEFPGVYANQRVSEIRLEFRAGRIVSASSSDNQAFLDDVLELDDGVRSLGEFGVGLNDMIDLWTYEILFDEKIGGTIHLALGRAFAACGGTNQSSVHWDIIKDLRTTGGIYLDGKQVFKDGGWLIDERGT